MSTIRIKMLVMMILLLLQGESLAAGSSTIQIRDIGPVHAKKLLPLLQEVKQKRAPVSRQQKKKTCRLCGRALPKDYLYCPYDGASLSGGAKKRVVRKMLQDGHLVAYNNGIVEDTRTGLMWPAKDNSENISWFEADSRVKGFHLGGYTDWRLPTLEELGSLFDRSRTNNTPATDYCTADRHLSELIHLSCAYAWSGDRPSAGGDPNTCSQFNFARGHREWVDCRSSLGRRTLVVRGGK